MPPRGNQLFNCRFYLHVEDSNIKYNVLAQWCHIKTSAVFPYLRIYQALAPLLENKLLEPYFPAPNKKNIYLVPRVIHLTAQG